MRKIRTRLIALGIVLAATFASHGIAGQPTEGEQPTLVLDLPQPRAGDDNKTGEDGPLTLELILPDGERRHPSSDSRHETNDRRERPGKRGENPHRDRRENAPREAGAHASVHAEGYVVKGVRITDIHSGKVLPIHEMDLKPTLDRIERGEKNPHRNDGSVYRNLNRQLPRERNGYYREYVVPTPGLRGPGPQRLIIGEKGEVYYTWDHYDNFLKIEGGR